MSWVNIELAAFMVFGVLLWVVKLKTNASIYVNKE